MDKKDYPVFLAEEGKMYSEWELGDQEADLEQFVLTPEYQLIRKCLVYRASELNEDLISDLEPETKGAFREVMSIIHFFDGYLPQPEDEQQPAAEDSSLLDSFDG